MVFEYVAVKSVYFEDTDVTKETIVKAGQIVANDREDALVKIGAELGHSIVDDNNVEVSVRPFLA